MEDKKKKADKKAAEQKAETPKKVQKFEIKKPWATTEKKYKVGDIFEHDNQKVINFLKSKNII